jgi:hypothetical protein
MFYLFNDYADGYSKEIYDRSAYSIRSSNKELNDSFFLIELLQLTRFLHLRLLDVWSFNLLSYKCVEFPNSVNYVVEAVCNYYEFSALEHLVIISYDDFDSQGLLNQQSQGVAE